MKLERIRRYIRGWFPQEPKMSRHLSKYGLGIALFAFLSLSFAVYILLNSSFLAYVGASSIIWSRTYGGADSEIALSFVRTSDGGYAITGLTSGRETMEWWFFRTDESGNLLWTKTYSGLELPDVPSSLIEISGGGYAFAGTVDSPTHYDDWLAKTDEEGNILWNQTYDSGGSDNILTMVQTLDGGYLLAGTTATLYYDPTPPPEFPGLSDEDREKLEESWSEPMAGGTADVWLIKTDANGNMEWNKIYPGGSDPDGWCVESLVATSDGGYALGGWMARYGEDSDGGDFWLAKADEFGNLEWSQTYGGTESEKANCLIKTSDGGYAMVGSTESFFFTGVEQIADMNFYLVKTDANGNIQWNRTYGETKEAEKDSLIVTCEAADSVIETPDGGFILIGTTYTYDLKLESDEFNLPIFWGCWSVKTDSSGNMEWNQTFEEKNMVSLVETPEGNYAFAGRAFDYDDFDYVVSDVWLGEIGDFNSSSELTSNSANVSPYTALIPIAAIVVVVLILFRNRIFNKSKGARYHG